MQVGLMAPQGWKYEYNGWEPGAAWARTLELAANAEALGFEAIFFADSQMNNVDPYQAMALCAVNTKSIRFGTAVTNMVYRDPTITACSYATLNEISSGRAIVGLGTGSLGILAEAAHSALDLVAALITLFAVRVSDRPADATHLYGHGKVAYANIPFQVVPRPAEDGPARPVSFKRQKMEFLR